jgi:hypothetical protein
MILHPEMIRKTHLEGGLAMFVVCLLLLCGIARPTVAKVEDALMAAAAVAGPRCDACPVDNGRVCAEMPTLRGVRQTVMSKCLAECQGFTNIEKGACKQWGNNSGAPFASCKSRYPVIRE